MRLKVSMVFVKSCINATEQQDLGNKTNKTAGTKLEWALNSLNVNYFIDYIQLIL